MQVSDKSSQEMKSTSPATGLGAVTGVKPPPPGALWDELTTAAFFGVSPRTLSDLIRSGAAPVPVLVGPRLRRWIPSECEAAVQALPRAPLGVGMPEFLAAGKARKRTERDTLAESLAQPAPAGRPRRAAWSAEA